MLLAASLTTLTPRYSTRLLSSSSSKLFRPCITQHFSLPTSSTPRRHQPVSSCIARRTFATQAKRSIALNQHVSPTMVAEAAASGFVTGGVKGESPGDKYGNFDCVRRVTMDYAPGMSVEKWVSRVTGLTILWANFESESRSGDATRDQCNED